MRVLRIFFQWLSMLLLVGLLLFATHTILTFRTFTHSVATLNDEIASLKATVEQFSQETREQIEANTQRTTELSDFLYTEQKRIDALRDDVKGVDRTVGKLSGSVETLEKLTTTDRQLLQKYSKVYFLNEHYMPEGLTIIDEEYDLIDGKQVSVHEHMWPFLKDMLEDALDDGFEIMVLSGYRSFNDQGTLKQVYTQRYGVGANQFSADQGYSEHQLGTAIDFTTKNGGTDLSQFGESEAYAWLKEHAHKYGFVLSYPENNEYYVYEPWHWRFVGKELADYLHDSESFFYNVEQRKIDTYLSTLFDK